MKSVFRAILSKTDFSFLKALRRKGFRVSVSSTAFSKLSKDVDIPKEVLDAFARYIIPEIRRFHESEEGQAFYKEWLEKHPEYAEK